MQIKDDEVFIEDFTVPKTAFGRTFRKSTGMDKVYVKDDFGTFKHVGYIHRISGLLTGLVNFPDQWGVPLAEVCSKKKGVPIRWCGAPQSVVEPAKQQSEDEEDEFA